MKHNYEKLIIWNNAMNLAEEIYVLTKSFPKTEQFGMINQMRRSSYSIYSNIAEGAARDSQKSFNHFLNIAQGSLAELHTQLLLSNRVGYIKNETLSKLLQELMKLKNGLFRFKESIIASSVESHKVTSQ